MKTVVQEQKQNHHHVTTTTNVLHQEKPDLVIHVNSIGASSSNTQLVVLPILTQMKRIWPCQLVGMKMKVHYP